jgi:hypothetical protein
MTGDVTGKPPSPAEPATPSGGWLPSARQLASRAWLRALLLSLAAVLAVWGRFLSPALTLNPQAYIRTVNPFCRAGGAAVACQGPLVPQQELDPGAPAWQEGPADHLFRAARTAGQPRPSWNPYSGSGTPVGLDAINASTSVTRWFLSRFPGDQPHDLLILARFLLFTFGLVWAAALAGAATPLLALLALAGALAPYGASYVDIVFLDVDLLAPWPPLLLVALVTGRLSGRASALLALALGAATASLGFQQSQVAACAAIGVLTLAAAPSTRGRSLLLGAGFAAGELLLLPSWLPVVRNLDQFTSSRQLLCLVSRGQGLTWFEGSLVAAPVEEFSQVTFTLAGAVLALAAPRRWRFLAITVAVLGAWIVLGLPELACRLPLLSGIRFVRHLVPHFQAAFLLLVALSAWELASRSTRIVVPLLLACAAAAALVAGGSGAGYRWPLWAAAATSLLAAGGALLPGMTGGPHRRVALAAALLLTATAPYLVGGALAEPLWRGTAGAPEGPGLPLPAELTGPLATVRELSQHEDRRHASPGGFLYPNWAAALGILDLFTIGALYPVGYHELNAGLFPWWERDPQHGLNPDRFVPPPAEAIHSVEFQRVLAVNRVSLLTFELGRPVFPAGPSPYERQRCRPVAGDRALLLEAWLCPDVGGVGYFPGLVERAPSRPAAIERLRAASPVELLSLAVLGPEVDLSGPGRLPAAALPAVGQVLTVERRSDALDYLLEVEVPGLFVVADGWFRGWRATVNGAPAGLSRCNVAFKAVNVPAGRVALSLRFEPQP